MDLLPFAPVTPQKPQKTGSSSHSRKTSAKGLTQKQIDLLTLLKDEPEVRDKYLNKFIIEDDSSDENDKALSARSSSQPDPFGGPLAQDPFEF